MPMKNPAHPGRIVRSACLEPLGLSVTEGAKVLGVTRQTLTKVINGKSGISPEMAIRLSKAFGSAPETWLKCSSLMTLPLSEKTKEESRCAASTFRTNCIRTKISNPRLFKIRAFLDSL